MAADMVACKLNSNCPHTLLFLHINARIHPSMAGITSLVSSAPNRISILATTDSDERTYALI